MGNVSGVVVAVTGSLFLLAMIAVIVSKNAQTPAVVSSAGSALSSVIGAAVSPVTGSASNGFGAAGSAIGSTIGGLTA